MAEEKQQLQGIDWQETFAFTNVFRSFRLAIHPSKLVLALAGLALCFIAGLVLDKLWYGGPPIIWENGQPTEIVSFAQGGDLGKDFPAWYEDQINMRQDELADRRADRGWDADDVSVHSASLGDRLIAAEKKDLQKYLKDNSEADSQRLLAKRREVKGRGGEIESIRDLVGKGPFSRGPFRALLTYELGVFRGLVRATVRLDLLGGLGMALSDTESVGVIAQVWRALKGLQWLLLQHWLYFVIFGLICLVVWAIFGGAISRIAALHVARDEKISIKEALKFAVRKFPSFLFAPLIPLAIVAVLGLLVVVGNLALGNWGLGIGEVLSSVLFFLSLIGGFVMALVAVGTVGGLDLTFPTIAVEGSDSFDAISRSFSYVYARPWRMAFYSLVALVYGVLCYLFVRFFAFLMLKLAYIAVCWGVFAEGNSALTDQFQSMWQGPSFGSLHGGFDWGACWGVQAFGAWVIGFWVYVVIGFVIAFLVSFFFSANTVIYYLLRKRVDATDMDDVYVEEEPAEEVPPVPEEPTKAEEAEKTESDKEEEEPSEDE